MYKKLSFATRVLTMLFSLSFSQLLFKPKIDTRFFVELIVGVAITVTFWYIIEYIIDKFLKRPTTK